MEKETKEGERERGREREGTASSHPRYCDHTRHGSTLAFGGKPLHLTCVNMIYIYIEREREREGLSTVEARAAVRDGSPPNPIRILPIKRDENVRGERGVCDVARKREDDINNTPTALTKLNNTAHLQMERERERRKLE
jgi:hypothetical protein